MNILKILQIIAVILTIVTGLVSLLWPRSVQGFTGLTAPDGRTWTSHITATGITVTTNS